ncbi:PREDICTED: F-box protein At4g02760-like [Brassica oleracea var. oleracea]|uniref:F-box protein At4g02760-like n=1 Tax=Brassica oleracea var. oleracea TaxID=109376 RepID=UPI0006A6C0A0|nr:PREDICTED: F-box protein At4g02760-like [Brassica oleracea var. oleracea]
MEAPYPNKRHRRDLPPCVPFSPSGPSSLPSVPDFNQNHVHLIISSLLFLPDLPSLSISHSFDRAIEKLLESSSDDDRMRIKERGFRLASLRFFMSLRKGALRNTPLSTIPVHGNSLLNSPSRDCLRIWIIQVFSMLDAKSLMRASACCIMFKKCTMDPLCYSHIDLTAGNAGTGIMRRMILNAGKELRSFKVGCP